MSIFPKFEKFDGDSVASSDATAMIVGELAGAPVFVAELPAAAIIRQPRLSAARPAAVYAACGGAPEPRDMEITSQRREIAQFIPARTPAVPPEPEFERTFPTKMWE